MGMAGRLSLCLPGLRQGQALLKVSLPPASTSLGCMVAPVQGHPTGWGRLTWPPALAFAAASWPCRAGREGLWQLQTSSGRGIAALPLPTQAGMATLLQLCSGGHIHAPASPACSLLCPSGWCCCSRSGCAGAGELIQLKPSFFRGGFQACRSSSVPRPAVLLPSSHPASTALAPQRGWGDRAVRSSPAPGHQWTLDKDIQTGEHSRQMFLNKCWVPAGSQYKLGHHEQHHKRCLQLTDLQVTGFFCTGTCRPLCRRAETACLPCRATFPSASITLF